MGANRPKSSIHSLLPSVQNSTMAVTTASASASLACEDLPHLCTCQHGPAGGSGCAPLSPASSRTALAALCSASASACRPAPIVVIRLGLRGLLRSRPWAFARTSDMVSARPNDVEAASLVAPDGCSRGTCGRHEEGPADDARGAAGAAACSRISRPRSLHPALPFPAHAATPRQARLEATLRPANPRKTLAWAMKTSRDKPQFLCNAQVRGSCFACRCERAPAAAAALLLSGRRSPAAPARHSRADAAPSGADAGTAWRVHTPARTRAHLQPPYVIEHVNAMWCELTGFAAFMIKGSHGLSLLKVSRARSTARKRYRRRPAYAVRRPPLRPAAGSRDCADEIGSAALRAARARPHTRVPSATSQGPLTDEEAVARAWGARETTIRVVHYTGTQNCISAARAPAETLRRPRTSASALSHLDEPFHSRLKSCTLCTLRYMRNDLVACPALRSVQKVSV